MGKTINLISQKAIFSATLLLMMIAFTFAIVGVLSVQAQVDPGDAACSGVVDVGGTCASSEGAVDNFVGNVVEILLYVVGVASVIMIIVGGIKYITSAGDAQAAASAKNTIIYSVVGLIVAIMAYAIAFFVFDGL